jgi:hypothetical protein
MERKITIDKKANVSVEIPKPECASCSFLYGEMAVLLSALKISEGEFQATASCHSRGVNVKHIHIQINLNGKIVDSDDAVRNWMRREVHCKV